MTIPPNKFDKMADISSDQRIIGEQAISGRRHPVPTENVPLGRKHFRLITVKRPPILRLTIAASIGEAGAFMVNEMPESIPFLSGELSAPGYEPGSHKRLSGVRDVVAQTRAEQTKSRERHGLHSG